MKRVVIGLAWLAGLCAPVHAESVVEFYKGKTIRVIVAQPPGDIYDTWARLIVRHMRGHIPGNPNMIVENMPGGGTLVAANFIFQSSPAGRHHAWLGQSQHSALCFHQAIQRSVRSTQVQLDW